MRMSEHAVDPVIVICMCERSNEQFREYPPPGWDISNSGTGKGKLSQTDRTFPTLAQVKNIPKTKVNPNDYYALLKVLSVGKFGAIYLGYDKEARAMRTVKIFRPRMAFFPDKFSKLEKRLLTLKTLPPMLPQLFMDFSFEDLTVSKYIGSEGPIRSNQAVSVPSRSNQAVSVPSDLTSPVSVPSHLTRQ
ncbi:hypothetical protein Btru_029786 [Bulinus truncatus]|nr:hypothetical protein Btru_029786 [Bulinus truncatus]